MMNPISSYANIVLLTSVSCTKANKYKVCTNVQGTTTDYHKFVSSNKTSMHCSRMTVFTSIKTFTNISSYSTHKVTDPLATMFLMCPCPLVTLQCLSRCNQKPPQLYTTSTSYSTFCLHNRQSLLRVNCALIISIWCAACF